MILRALWICFCVFALHSDEATISWSESYKLSWSDFQGPVQKDTDAVATTASGITFSYSIKRTTRRIVSFKTKIFAHFYPEKSWYKPEHADAHILSHEQYHFNITELHARKFRQRVSQLQITPSLNAKLDQIHKEINQELSGMQEQYDSESSYSRNFEQQEIWEKRIDEALQSYSKYKSRN